MPCDPAIPSYFRTKNQEGGQTTAITYSGGSKFHLVFVLFV